MPSPFNNWYTSNPTSMPSRSMVSTSSFMSWARTESQYGKQFGKHLRGEFHVAARQMFPKSFASGSIVAGLFAPTRKEALLNPWRRRAHVGSKRYMSNLNKLQELHPENKRIAKAIEKGKGYKSSFKSKLLGPGLSAAFVLGSAAMTEGGIAEKGRTGISAAVAEVGFAVGSLIGGPLGSIVGGIGMGALADATFSQADKIVDTERKRRSLDWGAHTAPFQTARAHTMRQQSLQLMNRGQMSARSLLGQEAVYVHK